MPDVVVKKEIPKSTENLIIPVGTSPFRYTAREAVNISNSAPSKIEPSQKPKE